MIAGTDESGARLSECGTYRYALWRSLLECTAKSCDWPHCLCRPDAQPHRNPKVCLFIMLNPSTADHETDDATIRSCTRKATSWGYTRLEVCNLFALRSTDPRALYSHHDPVGPENFETVLALVGTADLVVTAWGQHGAHMDMGSKLRLLLENNTQARLHYLRLNKDGQPAHPLYLPDSLQPQPWP